ncbi:MAG TPA: M23 family metallopeptidase, partial [Gaiellaceae bacterium]|nr:M23 family metallopeptidase [Gaiellaceae bacterium]
MRRLLLAAALAALLVAPLARAWTWPADGSVLQPYSFDPNNPYAGGQHRGVDVAGDTGGPVRAPAAGEVTYVGTVPNSGRSLTITTADGYAVTLTHLGSTSVAKGATVAEGDVVGTIGPSGDPEVGGAYVHLGIRLASDPQGYLDPASLLPARAPAPPAHGPDPAPAAPAGDPAPTATTDTP